MKIKTVVLAVCLSLVLTGMTTTGECGPQKGDIFISPMVGGHMFEGTMGIEDGLMGALGLGYMATDRCGLEAVLGYTMTETTVGALDTNVATGRLDAFYNLMTGDFVPYFAIGLGAVNFDYDITGVENDMDWMANYGLGCHYFFTDSLALRADVRHGISFDETQNHLLYTLGLTWLLGGGDNGTQVVKMKPAPEQAAPAVVEKPRPAPAPQPVVEAAPAIADDDRDGVPNDQDQCPGTPIGAKVNARGCWVIEGLNFERARADIMADSFAKLDEVVTVLKNNPELRLEVQGHTDSRGNPGFNQVLSEQRAGAVVRYFVSRGIAADRLVSKGFGPSQPIADNDTAEGRAENRRVELNPID
ncbi:OmpA family protein [Desulfosudis oleivorans]|nr:OmpA family protein [Desulfosudis oleivorans]